MVTFPYNTTDFAFTLEDVSLNFSTAETNSYFDLEITVNYYDFFSSTLKSKVLEYKIPLFNQAQTYNVGRKIHRYLSDLSTYNFSSGFQYKTASVSFLIKEIEISDSSIIDTITLNDVLFIAGPKPKLLSNNIALLLENTAVEKITKQGFFNVAFLVTPGDHVLEIYKNNVLETSETITATATDNIYLKKMVPADYTLSIGDVLKVKIKDSSIQKEIVISKSALISNQFIFLDAYKLPRSVEFTGEFSYSNQYNQITHTYKRNLVEILEIVATEKIKSLKITTGFLLPSETKNIDALLDSKIAFLIKDDAILLELVPIAKKLVAEDSTDESFEYSVEFQINKDNA